MIDAIKVFFNHVVTYPTPLNLNYLWSFGSIVGIFFAIQLLTGIFLAMHYVANIDLAFTSVEHIMRDVKSGFIIRYMHSNGASLVFIFLYLHIGKGLIFQSYFKPRFFLWLSGIVIFFLMILTAFVGYVLPWGQMSFWGATVITNLITAVPFVGESIAYWLWGGFSVGNPTLNRFFSIHYLLPFIILGLILLHLSLLHENGSTNPLGVLSSNDMVFFGRLFGIKDSFGLLIVIFFVVILIGFSPNMLGHSDNYIPANPLVTPAHIVPEWYFLPFYAILRAIPDKLGGVLAMVFAILIFCLFPFSEKSFSVKKTKFSVVSKFLCSLLICVFLFLGYIGGKPAVYPFVSAGAMASFLYFSVIFVLFLI